jgi:hypothetical protein
VVPIWAKLHEKSVVGCFFGAETLANDASQSGRCRVHFTYPADGNLHFSVARVLSDFEVFETYNRDRIRVKIIDRNTRVRSEFHRSPDLINDPLSTFVQRSGRTLSELANGGMFMFPVTGIPIKDGTVDGGLHRIAELRGITPKQDDTVVDLRQLPDGVLNVSACIYGQGVYPTRFENSTYVIATAQRGKLYLELFALF